MKWKTVQLWINEPDPSLPLLMSPVTEIWLYGEQMATAQNNKAVRKQTGLLWLHFFSIFINIPPRVGGRSYIKVLRGVRHGVGAEVTLQFVLIILKKNPPPLRFQCWLSKTCGYNTGNVYNFTPLCILWSSVNVRCQDFWLILAGAKHQINRALNSHRPDIRAQVQAFEAGLKALQRIKAALSSACEKHSVITRSLII